MLVIFTDLDGTLLDRESYSFEPAMPALRMLRARHVPLVLCSSKTRAEMEPLRAALQCGHPFIAENGSVLAIPRNYFPFNPPRAVKDGPVDVVRFGGDYAAIVSLLRRASQESGVPVTGFADMNNAAIASLTGLSLDAAGRARNREHDEPFLIDDESGVARLLETIRKLGKCCSRGGRFYHITDPLDKGAAVAFLLECYRRVDPDITAMGLGDAHNDLPLLRACDWKVIVRSRASEDLQRQLPEASITGASGPQGWNEAVLNAMAAV